MLRRRPLLLALAGLAATLPACAQEGATRPRYKVSAAELEKALRKRFPVRRSLRGLLDLEVDALRLLLLPQRQKVGATLAVRANGVDLGDTQGGELDIAFGLRYEPGDRSLRARDLDLLDLRWPGLRPDLLPLLQALLPRVARDAVGEVVLHSFTPGELGLADTMGLEPEQIEVRDDGLVVYFGRQGVKAPGS